MLQNWPIILSRISQIIHLLFPKLSPFFIKPVTKEALNLQKKRQKGHCDHFLVLFWKVIHTFCTHVPKCDRKTVEYKRSCSCYFHQSGACWDNPPLYKLGLKPVQAVCKGESGALNWAFWEVWENKHLAAIPLPLAHFIHFFFSFFFFQDKLSSVRQAKNLQVNNKDWVTD